MCDGIVLIQGDRNDMLHSILFSLADRFGNFYCLTETCTNMTVTVTYYYKSSETHVTATLNGLGYTLDGNNLIS